MKVYKERQFLVFDFEDGKTVKYDFATKTCIGKNGKKVKCLNSQLQGLTVESIFECCEDKQYAKFLSFIQKHSCRYGYYISNIGTILDRVPEFSRFEQLFSAGIDDIVDSKFNYTINDIPKGIIKLCRSYNIKLSNEFLSFYKENPDAYLLAYNLEYISLDDNDIYKILSEYTLYYNNGRYVNMSYFLNLINDFGYTPKALLNYIDYLKTYEAIEDMRFILKELVDYAFMMNKISPIFDKYPRHFLTTHKIACRNYNRLKEQFDEMDFQQHITPEMERTFGEYQFIYPKCTQDIKDESSNQHNCVSSYVKRVIDGECHILFLRKKDSPDKSLVTIEVRNDKIVQALQKFNNPLTKEQQEVVDKWNEWYGNKVKKIC